jgi:hypothetical protein
VTDTCPVCTRTAPDEVLDLATPVPVLANRLYPDAESARSAPLGRTRLVLCRECGHLWNAAFEPDLVHYDDSYENSLHHSGVFTAFADRLASRLVERFDLRGRTLVEIGSGQGDFLRQLCRLGGNRGIGYDPSYGGPGDPADADPDVSFVPSLFPTEAAGLDADFVYARHVLEHLGDPRGVLAAVRRSLGDRDCGVYVEVPDGGHLLAAPALWDLVYEHPAHFTASSLTRLLTEAGFGVLAVDTDFGGQFLSADADTRAIGGARPAPGDGLLQDAGSFAGRVEAAVSSWGGFLGAAQDGGRQVVVWGAGSKGATFLNIVPAAREAVAAIVDVNPRKHGRFVPGSGHEVVPPDAVRDLAAEIVLVMNPLYVDEVRGSLETAGIAADVVAVGAEPVKPAGERIP